MRRSARYAAAPRRRFHRCHRSMRMRRACLDGHDVRAARFGPSPSILAAPSALRRSCRAWRPSADRRAPRAGLTRPRCQRSRSPVPVALAPADARTASEDGASRASRARRARRHTPPPRLEPVEPLPGVGHVAVAVVAIERRACNRKLRRERSDAVAGLVKRDQSAFRNGAARPSMLDRSRLAVSTHR